jgi:hypothetical protein
MVQTPAPDSPDGHLGAFIADDTIVFLMDPASPAAVLERRFGTTDTAIATEQPHARTPEGCDAAPAGTLS